MSSVAARSYLRRDPAVLISFSLPDSINDITPQSRVSLKIDSNKSKLSLKGYQ